MVAPAGEGSSALGAPTPRQQPNLGNTPYEIGAPDDIVHSKDEKFDPLVVADVT
ncbi:hypothetical protein E143388_08188 [Rhodococcus opacus]|nr:hypothetical protein E143388_08188 [Rhodococcus opacus]